MAAAMVGEIVGDGTNESVTSSDGGMPRQQLTNLDSRYAGGNRLEDSRPGTPAGASGFMS